MDEEIKLLRGEIESLKTKVRALDNTVRILKREYNLKSDREFIEQMRERQAEIVHKWNKGLI